MALVPHTGNEAPSQDKLLPIKPRLVSWTSRIWRESPARAIPLFKIDARLEVRDIDDRGLQDALRPYAAQLQKIAIYVLHPEESPRLAPWAVGRFDVDQKSAFMFFHDFLGAPNGMLMLNLMQTAGAQTDIIISLDADDHRAAAPALRRRRLRFRPARPHRLASQSVCTTCSLPPCGRRVRVGCPQHLTRCTTASSRIPPRIEGDGRRGAASGIAGVSPITYVFASL